jgi:hypothetical protein
MPLGPGAEAFVVDWRAFVTSWGLTSAHWWGAQGGGSLDCWAETSIGFTGKKQA